MTWDTFLDVLLDALKDSSLVLAVVFLVHVILSLLEIQMTKVLKKNNQLSPLFGSMFGLIPQCGISVVSSDLYIKEHITMGTLVAVFLSCSDEAVPLMIAAHNEKTLWVIVLLLCKFVIGFIVGFVTDKIIRDKKHVKEHLDECDCDHDEIHTGCCGHHIDDEEEGKFHKYFLHPLLHSLKIFLYVFIINMIFGLIIAFVGEENFSNFIESNKYLTPLYATLIGLIPNCASSVVITELFLLNKIKFGAVLAGLLVNSGLGLIYLFKDKKHRKNALIIVCICFTVSLVIGYLASIIFGF